jgi:lipoic acid synthetase
LPSRGEFFRVAEVVRTGRLHTICESARCPNIGACWERRTATFLVLGDTCTRDCAFCAVAKGAPAPLDPGEPARVAAAVVALGLDYAVVTSVTRDDLPDGGAAAFASILNAVRAASPRTRIEALIPDFGGDRDSLAALLAASPEVLNHNLETTESLYPAIGRPRANYRRSLGVLAAAKSLGALTKSGLMIGLGESEADVLAAFADLRRAGCDLLTVGQYLQPTAAHPPVARYYTPEDFEAFAAAARRAGFREVVSGPLVRSSFEAGRLYDAVRPKDGVPCAI